MDKNIVIYPRQSNVDVFYNEASLVLNLSDKTQFIETFGMTALEAMSCGLPVIVPTEGGIAEMVKESVNGYKIDVSELDRIKRTIEAVLSDPDLYHRLAIHAMVESQNYSYDNMIDKISSLL